MKKFLSIALIALSMIVFVACGGSKKDKDNTDTGDTDTDVVDTTDTSDTTPAGDTDNTDSEDPNSEDPDSEAQTDECTGISIEWDTLTMYNEGSFYYAGKDPTVYIEFYQENNKNGFDVSEGTYDLGTEDNLNYSTCTECVSILKDFVENEEGTGTYEKRFFQKSGTLKIETMDNYGNIQGSLSAKLIEVTVDQENNYISTPVEGGACLKIESASFDTGVCIPNCEEGWECGNDGCGGSCGTCDGQACSADHKCVAFECDTLEVGKFDLISEASLFGTYYYYDAYTTGKGIGSESVPDLLEIGFQVDELETGIVNLTSDMDNIGDAYIFLYEDWDDEEYTAAKYYFQESGTLNFTEVKEGTFESKGNGSFRLVEIDTDYIPLAGGKCYEVDKIEWDTVCVPNCDGKICGPDGCGGTCGDGCGKDLRCSTDQKSCEAFNCTEITLGAGNYDDYYGTYDMTYSPNTQDDDFISLELYTYESGIYDLYGTTLDDCDLYFLIYEGYNDDTGYTLYFQQKGTVKLSTQNTAAGMDIKAEISGIRLEEVDYDYTSFNFVPVLGGACYEVKDTTINYTIPLE